MVRQGFIKKEIPNMSAAFWLKKWDQIEKET